MLVVVQILDLAIFSNIYVLLLIMLK